mgnify:CR=1
MKEIQKLDVIDGETLMEKRFSKTKFCIDTLLPQGVTVLGGAPKVGKSWLVLDMCVRVAKGENVFNLSATKGTVLYLCLEDTERRIQERLSYITDEVPENIFFATAANTLADGLCQQIEDFVAEHPDTVLIAIDTFQLVRTNSGEPSYAGDYQEIAKMKSIADKNNISILLVHHLRKQGDNDPLNKLSGTTGISGAVDAVFILDKNRREEQHATLICTGRDIEYREMRLKFDSKTCVWKVEADSYTQPEILLPPEMTDLIHFMKEFKIFDGSNTEFAEQYNLFCNSAIAAKCLKQMMNKQRYFLEEHGVIFTNRRSNGQRLIKVYYAGNSDSSDANFTGTNSSVTCDPCVPKKNT